MDYAITVDARNLTGRMSWDACDSLVNNVFLSLAVERGSWWHNPEFGLRKRRRLKNTESTAALIRHDYLDALQWLIDTKKALEVEVEVWRDRAIDLHRMLIAIEVRQADNRRVSFTVFREVV
ncbi:MAG: phage GP46 family protein [Desulfobulbus sp.]|jgi:phage gp46-like protein|uniref:phage GP46 family protein n=1 Tax=Desulfobulbus sp. TaxID=895 RepID=UPI002842A620|nr:phage GP46 family protein [Desulfobulbus sp.]MDR2551461.1 phage GP46 family protein [Desulfobulbus sp.]